MGKLRTVKLFYDDGTEQVVNCAGDRTDEQVRDYYVGAPFNRGDTEEHPADLIVYVTRVEFLPDLITCPHCGMGQFPTPTDGKCNLHKTCGKSFSDPVRY